MRIIQNNTKYQILSRHRSAAARRRIRFVASVCLLLVMCASVFAVHPRETMARAGQTPRVQFVTTGTPDTAACRWRLVTVPDVAAALILLDGRDAAVPGNDDGDVSTNDDNKFGFLERNSDAFAEQGFLVALPAEPVPEQEKNTGCKNPDEYTENIAAIISHIAEMYHIPVWIVGMDTGTLPAVSYAVVARDTMAGVVLLAPPVRFRDSILDRLPDRSRRGILAGTLERITAPVLLVTHRNDDCYESPPSGILMIRNRLRRARYFDIMYMYTNSSSQKDGDPCGSCSYHCFHGMDKIVVSKIARYIRSHSEQ